MTMSVRLQEEYRQGLREILRTHGVVVEISEREKLKWPDSPSLWVGTYGWQDGAARKHMLTDNCGWIVPSGVLVTEVPYSEFQDTFADNDETVGINGYGGPEGESSEIHCICRQFRGVTLRYQSSFSDALKEILGMNMTSMKL